ncbi:MAG TPA: glutathione peroxidase [Phycisphaerae bacterium]
MKFTLICTALAAAVLGLTIATSFGVDEKVSAPTGGGATPAVKPAALDFTVKNIDGKDVDLSTYTGKVIMILNVASKCGNTPQYTGLEKTYAKYKDKGFVIMGFPANNFGSQEPGTNEEIKEFCSATYQVDFPMFAKVSVKGNDMAPLFKYLTAQDAKPVNKGDIAWNFEKFLIGKDGKLIGRFANKTQPEDPSIVSAIESALAAK